MKQKTLKLSSILLILCIIVVCIILLCIKTIHIDAPSLTQNNTFCFDNIAFGTEVRELQKEHTDAKVLDAYPGVWEEETVLVRSFYSMLLSEKISACYYFDSQGFWKGVYEITVEREQEDELLDKLFSYLEPVMAGIEKRHLATYFPIDWKRFVNDNEYIRYVDEAGGVFRIAKYDTEEDMCKIELVIYQGQERMGSAGNGWPDTVEECWNGEDPEAGSIEDSALTYQEVWFMNFEKDAIVADPISRGTSPGSEDWLKNEKVERITYKLSPECEIWGMLSPNSFGRLSFEELVRYELTGYSDDVWKLWYIGLNSSGEIEHIYQGFLP